MITEYGITSYNKIEKKIKEYEMILEYGTQNDNGLLNNTRIWNNK